MEKLLNKFFDTFGKRVQTRTTNKYDNNDCGTENGWKLRLFAKDYYRKAF